MEPGDDPVLSSLRRGAVEYCVLALLREREWYGLDIARRLSQDGILMNGEGTLYPLLSRLRRAGHVATAWQESTSGPPRRYYQLTASGREALDRFTTTWQAFRSAVDDVLCTQTEEP